MVHSNLQVFNPPNPEKEATHRHHVLSATKGISMMQLTEVHAAIPTILLTTGSGWFLSQGNLALSA